MVRAVRLLVIGLVLSGLAGAAQTAAGQSGGSASHPGSETRGLPQFDLSPAQRQTIYTSIVNLNIGNESLPDFQPIVGATVPESVTLDDIPATLAEFMPQIRDAKVAMISGLVVLVDPQSRRVIEAIAGEKS